MNENPILEPTVLNTLENREAIGEYIKELDKEGKSVAEIKKFWEKKPDSLKKDFIELMNQCPTDNTKLLSYPKEILALLWRYDTEPENSERLVQIRQQKLSLSEPYRESKIRAAIREYIDSLSMTERPKNLQEVAEKIKDVLHYIDYPEPYETYTTRGESDSPLHNKCMRRTYIYTAPSGDIAKIALILSKELGLMKKGDERPLRRVWYALIKTAMERGLQADKMGESGYVQKSKAHAGEIRKPNDQEYTSSFTDVIKDTDLWYYDFGIHNPSSTFKPRKPKLFGKPILVGLEKRSYYDVLQNMADLLGFSIYSAGGQSKFAEQESAALDIHREIYDGLDGGDDLDIYIISDFDPAGIDIGINIDEHQEFYQKRFGRKTGGSKALGKRIAPFPDQYTRQELKGTLYEAEDISRNTWNLKEMKETREWTAPDGTKEGLNKIDDRGFPNPRNLGLEVESMPDQPIKEICDEFGNCRGILRNPPSDWEQRDYDDPAGDWVSLTRMRFILLDELIEKYGLETALEVLITEAAPNAWNLADGMVDSSNFDSSSKTLKQSRILIDNFLRSPNEWIDSYIEEEKGTLEGDIESWIEDIIDEFTDPEDWNYREEEAKELKKEIKNKLYYAISRNHSSISISFPEDFEIGKVDGYDDDFMITIPDKFINALSPIVDYGLCLAANVNEVNTYFDTLGDDKLEEKFDNMPPIRDCEKVEFELSDWYSEPIKITNVIWKETNGGVTVITPSDRGMSYYELEDALGKQNTENRKLQDQLDSLSKRLQENKRFLRECQEKYEEAKKGGSKSESLFLKSQIHTLENTIERLKKEKKRCETDLHECKTKIGRISEEKEKWKAARESQVIGAQQEIERLKKQPKMTEDAKRRIERLQLEILKMKQEKKEKEEEIGYFAKKQQEKELAERQEIGAWDYIDWRTIRNRELGVLDAIADEIEKEIESDPAPKQKVEQEKLDQFRHLIDILRSNKPMNTLDLGNIANDLEAIQNKIRDLHQKLN